MIKTEHEYLEVKKRVEQEFLKIEEHIQKMKRSGLNKKQIRLAIDPLSSFAHQLKEEIEEYEKLKRGQFDIIENLNSLGYMLVALRISKGMKQKELAEKMGVKESQVSRDERNEYYGASLEKIQKVLDALDVTLKSKIDKFYKNAV